MFVRTLAVALCLASATVPAYAVTPVLAPIQATETMTVEELMTATALDQLFTSFAETIATSPESQGVPVPANFLRAWKQTAFEVFQPDDMHGALATAFEDKLSEPELAELASFFHADFGKRITALENAVQLLSTEDQLAARDEGISLLEDMSDDSRRTAQFDEIVKLVSADVSRAMLGQAMRAMLMSMAVSGAAGDIEVPWEEIDAQLEQILPGLEAEITMTQRAIMAYAYKDLSDDELEQYLGFLRTGVSQKFYAVLGLSVGRIMESSMSRFGEELAHRLNQVSV